MRSLKTITAVTLGRYLCSRSRSPVAVLCYHSIHPDKSFATTPEMFAWHLTWLKKHCSVTTLEAARSEAVRPTSGKPVVAITFDDGYEDNYQYAVPLLLERGLTATFFVTTGLIERDPEVLSRFASERKCPQEQVAPLSWRDLREMARLGMQIGAHTKTHRSLAQLQDNCALEEMRASRLELENNLGMAVHSMAYPYGVLHRDVNERTVELAGEAGYQTAATTLPRSLRQHDHPLVLPRFIAEHDDVETLTGRVLGWWDLFGFKQEGRSGLKRLRATTANGAAAKWRGIHDAR